MITIFFRKNNQRRMTLSPKGHLSAACGHLSGGAAALSPAGLLSRVAHLSCLLVLLTATFCATAQNGVTVSNLALEAGTVTFDVSWKKPMPVEVWSDTVWVWVDYNDAGVMKRLPLSAGATLTKTSAPDVADVMEVSGNDKGLWVVGNARTAGSFSATVKVQTPNLGVFAGACVYASNYPPVGRYADGSITFTGTPPFYLTLADGAGTLQPQSSPHTYTYEYDPANLVTAFTDATWAPGVFIGSPAPAGPKVTPGARCGGGTVTLSASSSSAGAVIDWYGAPTGDEDALSSGNTYAPFLTATTTFYVQARDETTGLLSQRVPVTATVHVYEGEIDGVSD